MYPHKGFQPSYGEGQNNDRGSGCHSQVQGFFTHLIHISHMNSSLASASNLCRTFFLHVAGNPSSSNSTATNLNPVLWRDITSTRSSHSEINIMFTTPRF
ncbi:hypothetical protein PoB_001348000 [Plakobranchus ocellatus]|uniref:Uncharacterized protein n=1 Tax=Plakobranchus ocellatus TaxID=259542 RepID=A0AAV3YUW8_9GAST|nr:hypothetical protein PoB_001348000 [Plakobranchus ocellatus]